MRARTLGQRVLRPDAREKVTGRALFPGDLKMDGMLSMKVLFSDRAHARIVDIDFSDAERMPGVVAVLTHRDVPVNEYGLIYKDQPALCGDKVRSIFDRVVIAGMIDVQRNIFQDMRVDLVFDAAQFISIERLKM